MTFSKLVNVSKDLFLYLQDGLNHSTFLKIKEENAGKCFESTWHIISTQEMLAITIKVCHNLKISMSKSKIH